MTRRRRPPPFMPWTPVSQPETRRGRQLVNGEVVSVAAQAARVSDGSTPDDFPW